MTEDAIKQHGEHLGAVLSDTIRKRLSLDLKNLAVSIFLSKPLSSTSSSSSSSSSSFFLFFKQKNIRI